MRIIKTRLREMLPNASVFLDVDNHGAGKDFPHIDVSDAVLCYLSELWFTNAPCLREVVRAMIRKKPLIALLLTFNGEDPLNVFLLCPRRRNLSHASAQHTMNHRARRRR